MENKKFLDLGGLEHYNDKVQAKLDAKVNSSSMSDYYTKSQTDANIATEAAVRQSADAGLQTQIDGLASGAPLAASSVAEMTDTSRIYVNTTDGNWYYYNGSSWQIGGTYQSSTTDQDQKNLNLDLYNTNTKYSFANLIKSSYITPSLSQATWNDSGELVVQAGGYAFFLVTAYPRTPNRDYYIYFESEDLNTASGYNLKATTSATGTHYSFGNRGNFYYAKVYYSDLTTSTKYLQIRFDNRGGAESMTIKNLIFSFDIYKDITPIKNELNKVVYVDGTSGSDINGDGSYSHPYKSITKGLENADVLYIYPGEYYEDFDSVGTIERDKIQFFNQFHTSGKKVTINFSEKLGSTSAYNTIKRVAYSSTSDDDIYKVFVSQTLSPIVDATWDYPRVALWASYTDIADDVKLTPVLSLALCEATENSFYYDGTYIYINNDATTYYLSSTKQNQNGLRFRNLKDGKFTGIDFCYGYTDCCRFDLCSHVDITNCSFNHSNSLDGVEFYNSNVNMTNSTAYQNNNDGIGIQQSGSSSFINCDAYYNGQDGLSHHDNCIGNVVGGNYHHNGKAGVSTPTYGAYVNLYSIYSHDNLFGYQIYARSDQSVKPIVFNNCIGSNNNQYDLQVSKYEVLDYNSKYTTTNVVNNGQITTL